MKIPRKKELTQLQRQYKTDKKIGEALGGVPEYLVNYWRRKKNIPIYSEPKFSENEIEEAWLRHGDDFKAGRELNLSKAAFYSWRRKYGIFEKPTILKLEQLELHFGGSGAEGNILNETDTSRPVPAAVKLWRRMVNRAPGDSTIPDWFLRDHPDSNRKHRLFELRHGQARLIFSQPPETVEAIMSRPGNHDSVWGDRDFGRPDWQLIENRVVRPGESIIGNIPDMGGLGGIAVLCLPQDRPHPRAVCKVEFARHAGARADVEDRFLEFMRRYPPQHWKNMLLEFVGLAVERLTVDRKIKLAQLATSLGASAALCPFDDVIRRHFPRESKAQFIKAFPDRGAVYDREFLLEGRSKDLHLGVYDKGWTIVGGDDVVGLPVQTVVVGPDALPFEIAYAAEALAGRRIPRSVSMIVLPVSAETICDSRRRGWLENLIAAGASVVDPRMVGRLGLSSLLGGDSGDVLFTRPAEGAARIANSKRRLWFSGIRTATSTAMRGVIALP